MQFRVDLWPVTLTKTFSGLHQSSFAEVMVFSFFSELCPNIEKISPSCSKRCIDAYLQMGLTSLLNKSQKTKKCSVAVTTLSLSCLHRMVPSPGLVTGDPVTKQLPFIQASWQPHRQRPIQTKHVSVSLQLPSHSALMPSKLHIY